MTQNNERYQIRAVDRALRVLTLLADGEPRTLMELSDALELSNSTTFRLLSTLASYNFVQRDEASGRYHLGLATLELARSFQLSNPLQQIALPLLRQLRDDTAETVHLAVLDQMEVVYLEKLHGLHAVGLMSSQVGARLLAYCTGLGKVMLAFSDPQAVREYASQVAYVRFTPTTLTSVETLLGELHAIRAQGYAFDRGERESEVHCIAAPILGPNGRLEGALSVSGPASRMHPVEEQGEHIQKLLATARGISNLLGHRAGQPPAYADISFNHSQAR
ncbi:MAG: IclR family transcriptional regulator [Anaerolineae bacterium]|nr:IclR family transcriptional regulator [Anaerolineae bacterium]